MEKLQWFKFSPTDWKMGKIQRLPAETQIRFISLLCLYWNKDCVMSYDDAEVEIDKEHLDLLINKRVIKLYDGSIIIEFLNEQFVEINSTIASKSISGKVGNLKRWHPEVYKKYISGMINLDQALNIAHPSHTDNNPIAEQSQSIADKSREDNNIINPDLSVDWEKLIDQFNDITGKNAIVVNDKTKRQLKARLKEGYTKQNILDAIINCHKDEYHIETGHKYLTLEFISRADKLEKYCSITSATKSKKEKEDKL